MLTCLIARNQRFSLRKGLADAAELLPIKADAEKIDEAYQFVLRRLEIQLRDEGFRADVVSAAIEGGSDDPAEIRKTVEQLSTAVAEDGWQETFNAYSRCKRIVRELDPMALTADDDTDGSTRALLQTYRAASTTVPSGGVSALLQILKDLETPVNRFFDDVLVMAEDARLRDARLSLLQHIATLPNGIADLSRLEGF